MREHEFSGMRGARGQHGHLRFGEIVNRAMMLGNWLTKLQFREMGGEAEFRNEDVAAAGGRTIGRGAAWDLTAPLFGRGMSTPSRWAMVQYACRKCQYP